MSLTSGSSNDVKDDMAPIKTSAVSITTDHGNDLRDGEARPRESVRNDNVADNGLPIVSDSGINQPINDEIIAEEDQIKITTENSNSTSQPSSHNQSLNSPKLSESKILGSQEILHLEEDGSNTKSQASPLAEPTPTTEVKSSKSPPRIGLGSPTSKPILEERNPPVIRSETPIQSDTEVQSEILAEQTSEISSDYQEHSNAQIPSQAQTPVQVSEDSDLQSLSQTPIQLFPSFSLSQTPKLDRTHEGLHQSNGYEVSGLYTAIYSNIAVYEITVNGISVMRRRDDSKLNATQILKVAGVEKSKRTKILEREILTGQHEKVQGGYGKYQGTWIPFERGIDLCKQYSVYELLHPLLHFKPGDVPVDAIPTKEQAMAAKRRALKAQRQNDITMGNLNSPFSHSLPMTGPGGDNYSTPLSASASAALSMLGRAGRSDTIGGSNQFSLGQPIPARKTASMPMGGNIQMPSHYNQHQTQQMHQMISTPVRSPSMSLMNNHMSADSHNLSFREDNMDEDLSINLKRSKVDGESTDNSILMINNDENNVIEEDDLPTYDLESTSNIPLEPLNLSSVANLEQAKEAITQVFLDYNRNNLIQIFGSEEAVRGMDIDIPIDDLGHTALHWAAALARIPLVKELVRYGCDRRRSNYAGETVLIRAILVTNNYDQATFSQLLEILYPAIPLVDKQNRTILHHIALTAGIKGRSQASRYYLVSLLEWIIKRGPKKKSGIDLGRFLNEVVNVQDKNGDTALNIAARVGNKSIVQQLLDIQADPMIPNRAGLSPVDFGVVIHGNNNNGNNSQILSTPRFSNSRYSDVNGNLYAANGVNGVVQPQANNQYNGLKSNDILASISTMVENLNTNFQHEIDQKHSMIEVLRTKLRESTVALKDTRKQVENFQEISKNLVSLQRKGKNLQRALEEEDARFTISSENDRTSSLPVVFEGNFDPDQPFRIWSLDQHLKDQAKKIQADVSNDKQNSGENGDNDENADERRQPSTFSAEDLKHKLSDVPPLVLLRARVKAYKKNRENLLSMTHELKGRSVDLEKRFRKVISLCANVDEDKVDSLMNELLQAVESDPDEVDITRVAGFLKKVEDDSN